MSNILNIIESDSGIDHYSSHRPLRKQSVSLWRKSHNKLLEVGRWYAAFNAVITVLLTATLLLTLRGVLNFIFSEERSWDAVRINLRLLFVRTYPEQQLLRVWVSLGVIVILAGLSVGLSARLNAIPLRKIASWLLVTGTTIAFGIVLRQPSVLTDTDGKPLRDTANRLVRQSFLEAMSDRGSWWLVAIVIGGTGAIIWYGINHNQRRHIKVATVPFVLIILGLLVAATWVYPWGHFGYLDGSHIYEPGRTVAITTKIPWTVMWLLLVGAWIVGEILRDTKIATRLRVAVNLLWLLAPFIIYWVILRDPVLDWSHVWSVDVPMALLFAVGGSAVLWFLTRPGAGGSDRVIVAFLLIFSLFNWVAAFFGWYSMLQKARISFLLLALFALLASNFRSVRSQRLRLTLSWFGLILIFHYLVTMINTPSTLDATINDFLGGFTLTLMVAVLTLIFSFPLGVLLALARTSTMPIFRLISISYIEILRGVPLITILFFFSVVIPLFLPDGMDLVRTAGITLGYTLFSAAYLAENICGGLQAVQKGQYEASDALGLTPGQRTAFIVLPQALRASIPPLVGQAIATFKETSLIAIVGGVELLRIANNVISSQSEFLGVKLEGLLFVSAIYWLFAFSMSKYSQRLEKRLGVGKH